MLLTLYYTNPGDEDDHDENDDDDDDGASNQIGVHVSIIWNSHQSDL